MLPALWLLKPPAFCSDLNVCHCWEEPKLVKPLIYKQSPFEVGCKNQVSSSQVLGMEGDERAGWDPQCASAAFRGLFDPTRHEVGRSWASGSVPSRSCLLMVPTTPGCPWGEPHSQPWETQGRANIFLKLAWIFPLQWSSRWKLQIDISQKTHWLAISQRNFPSIFQSIIPPGPVIFICITSVWGKIQKIRT